MKKKKKDEKKYLYVSILHIVFTTTKKSIDMYIFMQVHDKYIIGYKI